MVLHRVCGEPDRTSTVEAPFVLTGRDSGNCLGDFYLFIVSDKTNNSIPMQSSSNNIYGKVGIQ